MSYDKRQLNAIEQQLNLFVRQDADGNLATNTDKRADADWRYLSDERATNALLRAGIVIGKNISTDRRPIYGYRAGRLAMALFTGRNTNGDLIQVSRKWRDANKIALLALSKGAVNGEVSTYVFTNNCQLAEIARHQLIADSKATA